MATEQSAAFLKQIDDLDRRVTDAMRQLREQGEFADNRAAFLKALEKQQKEIEARIDVLAKNGMSWELIKLEFRRDFAGMMAELLHWEERLDANTMKTA
jgi:hypothetical protein